MYLPYMQMAYNSSTHASTKYSPYFLVFGRDPALPCDIAMGTHRVDAKAHFPYVRDLRRRMQEAREVVKLNLERVGQTSAARYDLTRRVCTFQVGDKVWVSWPHVPRGQNKKLYHSWSWIEDRRGNACQLRDMSIDL